MAIHVSASIGFVAKHLLTRCFIASSVDKYVCGVLGNSLAQRLALDEAISTGLDM